MMCESNPGRRSSLINGRSHRTECRRRADRQHIEALWTSIIHVRGTKQAPNLERLTRYLVREHEFTEQEVAKLLRQATKELLVVVYTSVQRKGENVGAEQEAYRLPSASDDDECKRTGEASHDWYCFKCHQGGEVVKCPTCWRVFHPGCGVTEGVIDCSACQAQVLQPRLTQEEVNRYLEFALIRMREKSEPLHKMGHVSSDDEEDISCLKRRYFLHHYCDLDMMKTKLKEQQYRSLEEFRADASIVVHSANILFGVQSNEAELAEIMVKDCDYELDEIRLCCDCYWNSNAKPVDWFALPCRKPHQLVYAKVAGWPFWPSKVLRVTTEGYDVRFFGPGHHRAQVPKSAVKSILSSPRVVSAKSATGKRYLGALKELAECRRLLRQMNIDESEIVGYNLSPFKTDLAKTNQENSSPNMNLLKIRARSWDPSAVQLSSPSCKKALMFSSGNFKSERRHSMFFRRKRGRLISSDKMATGRDRWKRDQPPAGDQEASFDQSSLVLEDSKSAVLADVSAPDLNLSKNQDWALQSVTLSCPKSRSNSTSEEFKLNSAGELVSADFKPAMFALKQSCSVTVPKLRLSMFLPQRTSSSPVIEIKPCSIDQQVQVDIICAECVPEFDSQIRELRNKLDQQLKEELESLRTRMHAEYAADKQCAIERIQTCAWQEVDRVQKSISELHDKQREEFSKLVESKHHSQLSLAKKLQWCANCENEAVYYCCWATSYCSVDCQKDHWESEHKDICQHKPMS